MRRLGCFTPLGIIAGVLTLLIVTGIALASGGSMFSPGALSAQSEGEGALNGVRSHADIGGNCAACHVDPWSSEVMATRCLNCHTDIGQQLNDAQALHGALSHADQCRNCHTEHNGPQASLTHLNTTDFPHDRVGFSLATHLKLSNGQPFTCIDCHGQRLAEFDRTQCETCHRSYQADFATQHIGDFGNECMACHDGIDRYSKFDHNRLTFTLIGKHTEVACRQCHLNVRSVADYKQAAPTCIACHQKDDQHKGAFGTDCVQCHTSDSWQGAKFDHSLAVFKLTGAHVNVTCQQCHVNNVFKGTPQDCGTCHQKNDQHQGAFGTNCGQCHSTDNWQGAKFDHSVAAFKLTGAHINVHCQQCHINNIFKGTPQSCVACHAEPAVHAGQFGTNCAQCHTTTTWQGATFVHTFPLNHGEGGTIACVTCHTQPANFKVYTCYGCHEHDPIGIQNRHLREGIANFQDCVQCHATGREGD
ncbi:MAG TPA: hypothetical protein VFF70_05585 [Anaerolineae bacterium]|nr:hypothetical protein [Anaerolineae bacterium]